jgi:2-amino-4-hydroxy-6-hydroxymethyldihydropteridine diphosphokinase
MNQAIILLGSNMGNRHRMLEEAARCIDSQAGRVVRRSSLYETEPWGFEAEHHFLNQVLVVDTGREPEELMEQLLLIEKQMGRERALPGGGYASRIIDIDILFYDDRVIDRDRLKIPHPELHNRRFTLMPLQEAAPDLVHPVFNKTVTQLLHLCPDTSTVRKL